MSNEPEKKTYSLKESETNMLRFVSMHQQAIFASLLSTIATDRLAYHVTEHTQFELSGDFTQIQIKELEAPVVAQSAPASDGPAVVAAPEREASVEPTNSEVSNAPANESNDVPEQGTTTTDPTVLTTAISERNDEVESNEAQPAEPQAEVSQPTDQLEPVNIEQTN